LGVNCYLSDWPIVKHKWTVDSCPPSLGAVMKESIHLQRTCPRIKGVPATKGFPKRREEDPQTTKVVQPYEGNQGTVAE